MMPREARDDVCDCTPTGGNNPILMGEEVRKIKTYTEEKGLKFPDTSRLLKILTPTNCKYCVTLVHAYFCGNPERIAIYQKERR